VYGNVQLTNSSVLNLNIENLLTPAPILGSWVGFQTVSNGFTYVFPPGTTNTFTNAYTFTGSINIGLTNVMVQLPDGTVSPLTSANVAAAGSVATSGNNARVKYAFIPSRFSPSFRALPGLATGLASIPAGQVKAQSLAILGLHEFTGGNPGGAPVAGLVLAGKILYGTKEYGGSWGNGTVFAVNTNGNGFTNFFDFSATDTNGFNSDGANPEAELILSGNTLYGTANTGGSSGNGTVFSINTNGSGFATLYSFSATDGNGNNSDGANPQAGLILSGNTLYGTAAYGGTSGAGTIFAVNTDGTGFTNLYNFKGGSDGGIPCAGLILSGQFLYGTASMGGSSGNGTVFSVKPMARVLPPFTAFQQPTRTVLTTTDRVRWPV
jgi:uncharacterized repeat protein (TIGR03803 family)